MIGWLRAQGPRVPVTSLRVHERPRYGTYAAGGRLVGHPSFPYYGTSQRSCHVEKEARLARAQHSPEGYVPHNAKYRRWVLAQR